MNILERSKQRYSVRKYTTQAVEKEKIEYLLECARWAPSAVNFQPWKLIAVEHIVMAVSEVGLGTCWVCNFDPSLCTTLLNLPEGIEPVALLPIGYPNDSIGEKKRKSMSEIVEWK